MNKPVLTTVLMTTCSMFMALSAHAFQLPSISSDGDVIKPIRFAKVKAVATKTFTVQNEDGTYDYQAVKICDVTGEAPVYEWKPGTNTRIEDIRFMNCEADLKVGRVTLNMAALIPLLRNNDIMGDGEKGDYKVFANFASVSSKDGSYNKAFPFNYAAVGNHNEKTMVLTTEIDKLTADKSTDKTLDERIQVIFKFED